MLDISIYERIIDYNNTTHLHERRHVMAVKQYEVVVEGNKTELRDVEEMVGKIRTICSKVEKAQDAYKKAAEYVYLIKKHKAYKSSGLSFVDYMREKTGMGGTTAKSLAAIWERRIAISEMVIENDIKELLKHFDSLSMRQLLTIVNNPDVYTIAVQRWDNGEFNCIDEAWIAAYDTFLLEQKQEQKAEQEQKVEQKQEAEQKQEKKAEQKHEQKQEQKQEQEVIVAELYTDIELSDIIASIRQLWENGHSPVIAKIFI